MMMRRRPGHPPGDRLGRRLGQGGAGMWRGVGVWMKLMSHVGSAGGQPRDFAVLVRRVLRGGWFWACLAVLGWTGCSARHYRNSADRQVMGIVQQVEAKIFGHTNAFTIDTPYSSRDPQEIKAGELIEDRLEAGTRYLTLEDALDLAATNSREYQSEKEALYLTALTLTGARHAFSPQFFGRVRAESIRESDAETAGSVQSQVGVSQMLRSGGSVGASIANDLLRYYTGDPRRSAVSTLSVNLFQPLLRGFGRDNPSVEALTQAERNMVYAVRDYSFFQDSFALRIANDYFRLLAQKDIIRNRYTNYLSRVESTKRLEARAGDRERVSDVDQARQAELSAKNSYINTVAVFRNALDQFKITLGMTLGDRIAIDDAELNELVRIGLIPTGLDPQQGFHFAVQHHLPTLNAIDELEDSKRKVRVAADRLRADLNLLADASLESDRPTDYTQFNPDNIRAGVGLQLNLPFDRLSERNQYRATLISFEADLRALTLVLDRLRQNIERGLRTLEQRRQNYTIQKNALDLANRRVQSTTLLLQAGRAEVRDLVDAQDAQISAQNDLTAALVDYQETRLELMLNIGALKTAAPKFWLDDHLTPISLGAMPAARPGVPSADEPVRPPQEYFENSP